MFKKKNNIKNPNYTYNCLYKKMFISTNKEKKIK